MARVVQPRGMVQDAHTDLEFFFFNVSIDAMTEAYATVTIHTEIRPNQCRSLASKVDSGTDKNVMPLHILANLFPRHISANDK